MATRSQGASAPKGQGGGAEAAPQTPAATVLPELVERPYAVLSPLRRNGTQHNSGTVLMTDAEAAELIKLGVLATPVADT